MSQSEGLYCGIDPGQTGAVVLLGVRNLATGVIQHWSMPTVERNGRNVVDAMGLALLLRPIVDLGARFAVEKVWSRPGQGVASMFGFGHSLGVVEGVLGGLGVEPELVVPTAWKPAIGAVGADKMVIWGALESAKVRNLPAPSAKMLGVADAAGIALWLSRLPVR